MPISTRFRKWLVHQIARVPLPLLIGLAMMSMLAPILVRETTRMGIGLTDDSFAYISSAEGIAAGEGYGRISGVGSFKPLTSFPPLYSASLSVVQLTGLEFLAAARLINGIALATTVFLSGLILYKSTSSSISALSGAGLILASGTIHMVHSWALSEGLFLSLSMASILLIASYLVLAERKALLILGAVTASMAVMTRFIGLAIIPPALAALYLNPANANRQRLKNVGIYVGVAITPLALFYARNYALTGNFANAPGLDWHPPSFELLREGADNLLRWFWPYGFKPLDSAVAIFVSAAFIAALMIGFGRRVFYLSKLGDQIRIMNIGWPTFLLTSYSLSYLAFLLFSMTFVHQILRLIPRIMAPLYINFALLFIILLKRAWDRSRYPLRYLILLVGAIGLIVQIQIGFNTVSELRKEGQGFNSNAWRASPTIEVIKTFPDLPFYTNDLPALYFLADRRASIIPVQVSGTTGAPREDFEDQLVIMRERMENQGAIMVLIGPSLNARLEPGYLAVITEGLILFEQYQDGMLYELSSRP